LQTAGGYEKLMTSIVFPIHVHTVNFTNFLLSAFLTSTICVQLFILKLLDILDIRLNEIGTKADL
jgi:hypothetical protein